MAAAAASSSASVRLPHEGETVWFPVPIGYELKCANITVRDGRSVAAYVCMPRPLDLCLGSRIILYYVDKDGRVFESPRDASGRMTTPELDTDGHAIAPAGTRILSNVKGAMKK